MASQEKVRPPIVWPALLAAASLPCTGMLCGQRMPPEPITVQRAHQVRVAEEQTLVQAGLVQLETRMIDVTAEGYTETVALAHGECFGAVMVSLTSFPLALEVHEGDAVRVQAEVPSGYRSYGETALSYLQAITFCASPFAEEGSQQEVELVARYTDDSIAGGMPRADGDQDGALQLTVLRGSATFDIFSLPRGTLEEGYRMERWRRDSVEWAEHLDATRPVEGEAWMDPVRLAWREGPWLAPDGARTREAVEAAAFIGTTYDPEGFRPPVHPASLGARGRTETTSAESAHGGVADAEGDAAADPNHRPMLRRGDDLERLLAVIDPGDLPDLAGEGGEVPCVRLRFARLDAYSPVAQIRRTDATTWEVADLSPAGPDGETYEDDGQDDGAVRHDGIFVTDTRCPGDPIALYSVPDTAADFVLRVHRTGESGRRQPARPVTVPPPPLEREEDAACDEGDADACLRLARRYRDGYFGEVRHDEAERRFRALCDDGSRDACLDLAEALGDEGEREARRILARLCEPEPAADDDAETDGPTGDSLACALLADRYRTRYHEAPFDPEEAKRLYAIACDDSITDACTNLHAMELLNL